MPLKSTSDTSSASCRAIPATPAQTQNPKPRALVSQETESRGQKLPMQPIQPRAEGRGKREEGGQRAEGLRKHRAERVAGRATATARLQPSRRQPPAKLRLTELLLQCLCGRPAVSICRRSAVLRGRHRRVVCNRPRQWRLSGRARSSSGSVGSGSWLTVCLDRGPRREF